MIETHKSPERAFIVGVKLPFENQFDFDESLKELAALVDTAGAQVINTFTQNRQSIDTALFLGKGKVEELKAYVMQDNIDTVIFDTELSPRQIRNLEKEIGKKILDRSWIILDIFASRAKTREAKTQVELAQLKYFMPRLTRQWTHLSRQVGGGVGTKGPGETQLETDKRLIKDRISQLEKELKDISKQRNIQRRGREDIYKVVLVGYTNVGKSTIMNKLSDAGILAENRLFATLDSTTRIIEAKDKKKFLLSDTVGFINKLPHNLVASFKSTLEEVVEADLLLHIIDVSHPNFHEQMKVVDNVLHEIGALNKKIFCVFNKADLLSHDEMDMRVGNDYKGNSIFISAEKGKNLGKLVQKVVEIMESDYVIKEIILPLKESKIISSVHSFTEVLEENYGSDTVTIRYRANPANSRYINHLLSSMKKIEL